MKTSVIGFPRIGTLRELKFALEKYFRKEIEAEELLKLAANLRKTHWETQKNAGIDYISGNDFSYYDMMLDTAVLFGIIPRRYQELGLSEMDTYFAMARGYQGPAGDVRALAMKKWFNTNYHYIVPELEDDTSIKLSGKKLWEEYAEAKKLGIETKPVVIGAYQDLLKKCEEYQIAWIQFDEPSLVCDMTPKDLEVFHKIYDAVLPSAKQCHVLLQTYFGDVRDAYFDLINMPFSGIGLDFIEGKETYHLIETYGFPQDKWLFAGLVNGKNIWKNHYGETLRILDALQKKGIQTVLSTSCSLLHVPYTIKHETQLPQEYLAYFAFAEEKLVELAELKTLIESEDYCAKPVYQRNEALFAKSRNCENPEVKERLSHVKDTDYVRLPVRKERRKLQKEALALPLLPTTTIGSFPQTKDVKANRAAYRKGEISGESYIEFNRKKIEELLLCILFCLISLFTNWYGLWLGGFIGCTFHFLIHIGQSIVIRKYIPCLITSIVELPISVYVIYKCIYLLEYSIFQVLFYSLTGIFVIGVNLAFAHMLMRYFSKYLKRYSNEN